MGKTLPKPVKVCKKCKSLYVDDDLYKGRCPNCGSKS